MTEAVKKFFDDPNNKKRFLTFGLAGVTLVVAVILIQIFGGRKYPAQLYIDTVAAPLATRLDEVKLDVPYYNKKVKSKTARFYKRTKNKTKWLEYKKPNGNYLTFVTAVEDGAKYGLNPDDYDLEKIKKTIVDVYENKERTPEDIYDLDIKITASFFLFTTHLIEGRIRTAGYGEFIWKKNIPQENDIDLLAKNSSDDLSQVIDKLHSPHEQYEKLREALIEYRKLEEQEKNGEFKKVSLSNKTMKPGDNNASIPLIRKKLFLTDIKSYEIEDSLLYDEKLEEGVKQFQQRHGLVPDGIINDATRKYLAQSFKAKADLIELNLERIRWLPTQYGEDYISINVPEYMLRVFEKGKKALEMKVVLGTEFNATPIFSDTLVYIVFSPTWNVPTSIFGEEMLPDLQTNPLAYDPERFMFYENGEEIHPEDIDWNDPELDTTKIKIVERPGQENSLGLVKFIMPNNFNIYMHDTPADRLFERKKRAYSHGCIRLEKPVEMAKYLLRDNNKWDEQRILESMKGEDPETVYLKKKYHVEIEYRTVWVDEKGLLNFREDVYGHDRNQLQLLKRMGGV